MDGFGTLLIFILIILLVYLIKKLNAVDHKINRLNDDLKRTFKSLSMQIDSSINSSSTKKASSSEEKQKEPQKENRPPVITHLPQAPPPPPTVEKPEPKIKTNPEITSLYDGQKIQTPIQVANKSTAPIILEKKRTPPPPPRPSFMERNPDLEKFIGENLLSKIGIVIFVIGMGFLVKLGIDNGVITEGMRVAIGVLIGGTMVGLAYYLRKKFATFSSILIGGALSVLYFTIAIAFHEYEILPQTGAFLIMVGITAFGVILSLSFDKKELAVLAIIGGFGTPFFVSTGAGNFQVLFTYILILDIGMLALVYFKKGSTEFIVGQLDLH